MIYDITYQDYLGNKFSSNNVSEIEFVRLKAYANQAVEIMIDEILPRWSRDFTGMQDVISTIKDCIVQQVEYLKNIGMNQIDTGQVRKSESMEGYSIQFESIVANGVTVCPTIKNALESVFRANGLMYRGL